LGTPVALAWQDSAASTLWLGALLRDLLQHGPLMVLAESAGRVDPWMQQPELAQALAQGRLKICLMAPNLLAARRPQGMPPVFDELVRAGMDEAHALLLLASPRVHLGHSVADVQQWGRQISLWCRGRSRPVVLGFDQWDNALQVLSPLRSLAEVLEHVALLGSEALHPLLFVERWNGSDGPLFEARFGLKADASGQRLAYDGSQRRGLLQRLVEAPDQYQVFATQAVLAGQRGVPPDWQVLANLGDVLEATHGAQAATVLLHAGSTTDTEDLLHLVYQLRSRHGRALKIVVRETQDKLRSNLEQALLCLGANSVVYREVGFARMVRLLDDLSDSTFARDLQPDYALARNAFMPDALRGYLSASAFCDTVQAMLERTLQMGLRHSFLRLSMQSHVAHADAVRACVALRDGDVLTADHDALYVFMFACAESDIDPALARLFSIPPTELFAAQTTFRSVEGMRSALRDLRESARQGVPDYSAFSSQRAGAGAAAGTRSASASAAAAQAPRARATHLLQEQPQAGPEPTQPPPTVRAHPLARRSQSPDEGAPHVA
jgi:cellulose biosynthesis protein BcsE